MLRSCLLILAACVFVLPFIRPVLAEGEPDGIDEAIAQETRTDFVPDAAIPTQYLTVCAEQGTIEEISYPAHDYFGDGAEYTKHAYVYLPHGYSTEKRYKVLILCHGIGGSEKEWGLADARPRVQMIMDHLIMNGEIEPFIIVTPNGRAGDMTRPGIEPNTGYMAFYQFGKELREDLLPWIDAHYATYGSDHAALQDARDWRAMAGLSMGGMQTINIGMCECLDLFAWFGAFSACPTTYTAAEVARKLHASPEDQNIRFFYNLCGTGDTVAYQSASQAAKNILPLTSRLNADNFTWQERPGAHDFGIWYLGLYNFARIFGAAD